MAQEQRIRPEYIEALELVLHGQHIGILVHYSGGQNTLTFDPDYRHQPTPERPVFTLTQILKQDYLASKQNHAQRLPPVLSNLLPEGALREWLSSTLLLYFKNAC